MRKKSTDSAKILPSDITPYGRYLSRRTLLGGGLGLAVTQSIGGFGRTAFAQPAGALTYVRNAALSVSTTLRWRISMIETELSLALAT